MRARRTGGDHGDVGPLDTVHDREVAGNHIDDVARHEERGNLARPALQQGAVILFDAAQAADSRADGHTDTFCVCVGDLQAGIADGLHARGDAVVNERLHLPGVFLRHVFGDVEVFDLPAEAHRKVADIERGDRLDAAPARENIVPGFADRETHRRDDAQSSDDNAPAYHGSTLGIGRRSDRRNSAAAVCARTTPYSRHRIHHAGIQVGRGQMDVMLAWYIHNESCFSLTLPWRSEI